MLLQVPAGARGPSNWGYEEASTVTDGCCRRLCLLESKRCRGGDRPAPSLASSRVASFRPGGSGGNLRSTVLTGALENLTPYTLQLLTWVASAQTWCPAPRSPRASNTHRWQWFRLPEPDPTDSFAGHA